MDIDRLDNVVKGGGTVALLAGMIEGAQKFGFQVRGFDAYVSTNVIAAAGVSSSASFEMAPRTFAASFISFGIPEYSSLRSACPFPVFTMTSR